MHNLIKALTLFLCFGLKNNTLFAQQGTIKGSLFEGTVVAGYVDKGAYINCTGPAVKYSRPGASILLGLLPTLKIKEDKVEEGKPKNSVITPTLGFGMTACIGHFALQMPAFYTAKTATTDGKWKVGLGIGYKF
ncbi:hypothetical protein [Sphingobacterium paludis]|jgi:hypothetical protein|uniref:Uncharacterized protein n=1 Tax=Sphingobacterium paludis TaxID=1476465 RepID=A0A4R7CTB1_9SPHI|nr:hypothetical protein [Sphingobacterium paludis]TDS10254.1 hypothetical protein B0I21_10919 [Sphingobacterium paludis]